MNYQYHMRLVMIFVRVILFILAIPVGMYLVSYLWKIN